MLWVVLVGLLTIPPPTRADTGQFLLISDIHFDPFYDAALFDRLVAEPVERWSQILAGSQPAGLNPRGTDSNQLLLASSLDDVRLRGPDPDFVLYPGDFLAHQWQAKYDALAAKSHIDDPEAYRAFTAKVVRYLAAEFRRRYPNTPILPTLGNDDSYCGDYQITPDGPFLGMFAETWEPLLGSNTGSFRETFPVGGYYTMPLPHATGQRLVVLNSVVFSVNYDNACGSSTQTPALDQLEWLGKVLDQAAKAGESVWLLMHIPPGINSFNSAQEVPHGGAPVTFWQPELTAAFLKLVEQYRTTLRIAFAGHTHMDDFRVVRIAGAPVLPLKIAPAISPIFDNNPGYQVYTYDRETGGVHDYQTRYLTNLPDRDVQERPTSGRWAFEYAFRETYDASAIDARTLDRLADRIASDGAARQRYSKFYSVSGPPEFTDATFGYYRCAITHLTPSDFLGCLDDEHAPKASVLPPDRLPRRQP